MIKQKIIFSQAHSIVTFKEILFTRLISFCLLILHYSRLFVTEFFIIRKYINFRLCKLEAGKVVYCDCLFWKPTTALALDNKNKRQMKGSLSKYSLSDHNYLPSTV